MNPTSDDRATTPNSSLFDETDMQHKFVMGKTDGSWPKDEFLKNLAEVPELSVAHTDKLRNMAFAHGISVKQMIAKMIDDAPNPYDDVTAKLASLED